MVWCAVVCCGMLWCSWCAVVHAVCCGAVLCCVVLCPCLYAFRRSLLVWISDLAIFYIFTNGKFGESWTWSSYLQLAGFVVLLIGTIVYNYTTLYVEIHHEKLQEQFGQYPETGLPQSSRHSQTSRSSAHSKASSSRSYGAQGRLPVQ